MPFILIAFTILGGFLFSILYNRFATLSNERQAAFAQSADHLSKRHLLVGHLLDKVSTYTGKDNAVLQQLKDSNESAKLAKSMEDGLLAEKKLDDALAEVFATAASLSGLNDSSDYLAIQKEMSAIDLGLAGWQEHYNQATGSYNRLRLKFPGNWIARYYKFEEAPFWGLLRKDEKDTYLS